MKRPKEAVMTTLGGADLTAIKLDAEIFGSRSRAVELRVQVTVALQAAGLIAWTFESLQAILEKHPDYPAKTCERPLGSGGLE
jgi:hypothetical protein